MPAAKSEDLGLTPGIYRVEEDNSWEPEAGRIATTEGSLGYMRSGLTLHPSKKKKSALNLELYSLCHRRKEFLLDSGC